LNLKDEIVEKMKNIKEADGLGGVFFAIVDILNEECFALTSGEKEDELFTQLFDAKNQDGALFVDGLVSRKKQIVPKFEEHFAA
jgi:manganese-dependent inorganic pyrophosphatase